MRKAAIYLRVSTRDLETENQARELREVALGRGWRLSRFTRTVVSVAPRVGISDRNSTGCARMLPGIGLMSSWLGRSTVSADRCKTSSRS